MAHIDQLLSDIDIEETFDLSMLVSDFSGN